MPTIVWTTESNVFLLVHGEPDPTAEEWDALIVALASYLAGKSRVRSLIVSPGSRPNLQQRKQLNEVLKGVRNLCSVVTGSAVARTVVTILRLRNPEIRAFDPEHLESAFDYLELDPSERRKVRAALETLREQVGLVGPA